MPPDNDMTFVTALFDMAAETVSFYANNPKLYPEPVTVLPFPQSAPLVPSRSLPVVDEASLAAA